MHHIINALELHFITSSQIAFMFHFPIQSFVSAICVFLLVEKLLYNLKCPSVEYEQWFFLLLFNRDVRFFIFSKPMSIECLTYLVGLSVRLQKNIPQIKSPHQNPVYATRIYNIGYVLYLEEYEVSFLDTWSNIDYYNVLRLS